MARSKRYGGHQPLAVKPRRRVWISPHLPGGMVEIAPGVFKSPAQPDREGSTPHASKYTLPYSHPGPKYRPRPLPNYHPRRKPVLT